MDLRTKAILCDPHLVAVRDHHFARLAKMFRGELCEHPFQLWGVTCEGRTDPCSQPERWVQEALDEAARHADMVRDEDVFRPVVVEFPAYGVHFVDRLFGAEVFELDGAWQVRRLDRQVGRLEPPDLESDPTVSLARRAAKAFVDANVTVPLFGLPTIASALNAAVNLYGQDFLAAMHEAPDAARHDLEVINETLCGLHRWYIEHVPERQLQPVIAAQRAQPPGHGQLCGCTSQLASDRLYRDMVAPLDVALLNTYPNGGMIHLCGHHTHHIPVWRDMAPLRAVQLNDVAVADIQAYAEGLRPDQVLYANPCDAMPAGRIRELVRGRPCVLVCEQPPASGEATSA